MNIYKSKRYLTELKNYAAQATELTNLSGKRVFITGASGLIGSYLVDLILAYDSLSLGLPIHVVATGRSIERLVSRYEGIEAIDEDASKWLSLMEYDVISGVPEIDSIDYIIHAGGNAFPAAINDDPVGTTSGNVQGITNLLEYARLNNVSKVLYISSGEVYGEISEDAMLENGGFTENMSGYIDPLSVRSCYPLSKKVSENLCVSYFQQFGINSVIVRPCHTFGANAGALDNRVATQFIAKAAKNEDLVLKSNGLQYRSWLYVGDCVIALLKVLIYGNSCEAYNIASTNCRSTILEFAQFAASCSDSVVKIRENSERKEIVSPIQRQILNSEKLEKLGWMPKFSLLEGIANSIDIIREL